MGSSVDAALTALVVLLEAQLPSAVQVHDGPPASDEGTHSWVAIGYQPDTIDAVVVDYEWAGLGAQKQEESYRILCSAFTGSGDERAANGTGRSAALRTALMTIRDQIAAVLRADPTVSNTVRLAHISEATLQQWQGPSGVGAGLRFTISAEARISN